MAKRQRIWAAKARLQLVQKLGNACAVCGTSYALEFDCIKPQGDRHHRIEWSARISFYRRQHREGNLQLLCGVHHLEKSKTEAYWQQDLSLASNPF